MIDAIVQGCIAAMSVTATYLSLHPTRQRYACMFGLGVQPFWMVSTVQHQQWGMFALCFVYGGIWAKSAWKHWGKK